MSVSIDDVKEEYDSPWEAVTHLLNENKRKDDQIQDLEKENEQLHDRIDTLESELENQSQNISGAFSKLSAIDDMEDRLDYQKETIMDILGNPQEDSETHQEYPGETPMEEVVSYPEQVAQQELSSNAERARFIAMDVKDYAQKAPAGFVIDSSTIRKVIKAKEGERPHTQTVDRIMDFLDTFGKSETEKKKRRGRNKIVFSRELVKRMNHTRCDGESATDPERGVVTG